MNLCRRLLLLTASLAILQLSHAQGKANHYGSLYFTMGSMTNVTPGDFDSEQVTYGPGKTLLNLGLGSALYSKRHNLHWEVTFNHKRQEKGKFFRNLEHFFVTLRYGYNVLKGTRHNLYPYTGLGYAGLFHGRNDYFSEYYNKMKSRIVNYSMFYFDEGLGYTYAFEPEKANLFSTVGVMVGTVLSGNKLMSPEMVDGPDIAPAFQYGLYARMTLSIAYSMENKCHRPLH